MPPPEVEMDSSSSPFSCANTHDACNITHSSLQKNIIVNNNLNISVPTPNHSTQNPTNKADTWVLRVAKNNLGNLSFTTKLHNICRDNKEDSSSLSALMSPRHSKIVDRWAATARQQAQEMVTTVLKNNEVDVNVMNNFPSRSSSFNSRQGVVSLPYSDGSFESEISNLGASSLVRIWEKRLNNNCPKTSAPSSLGRTSSNASSNENAFSIEEELQSKVLENDEPRSPLSLTRELGGQLSQNHDMETHLLPSQKRKRNKFLPIKKREDNEPKKEESLDSVKVGPNDEPKMQNSTSNNVVLSKRGRVANIIKRLTVTTQRQSPIVSPTDDNGRDLWNGLTRSAESSPKQEHRAFAQAISFHRIRGRKAFNDLLMQFESERHGELHNLAERCAVSKFTQRGRIQSMLRLRLLQRGVAVEQSHLNKQQGSRIMRPRERFDTGAESRTSSLVEVPTPRSPSREIQSNMSQLDNFPTSNWLSKDTHYNIAYDTSIPCEKPTENFVSQSDDPKETIEASSSMVDSNPNVMIHNLVESGQHYNATKISYDEIPIEEDATSSYSELIKEEEGNYQNYDGTSYDWISHISRPKSYWEKLRQEWYREKLDFASENDEICKLLERRAVSTFLSSDFCERLESLMKSNIGTQTGQVNSQCEEEEQEESMDQLMTFFQERLYFRDDSTHENGGERVENEVGRKNIEEEEEENKAEEHEEESFISSSDHEGDYCNQSSSSIHTPSPSSWSYRDNDASDDSDRVMSMSSPLLSQSQPHHRSIEMEFLYEMRGQMDQLFHEMFELRKTLKSCMDMQMQMQQSKNQEVYTVKEENKLHNKTPKQGKCCICDEKKVNSVLYRCGHMCACLKCAKELQWNNGKCPKCQAPIIDVVRVNADTRFYDGHGLVSEE